MKTTNPFIASVCDQSGEVVELIEVPTQGQTAEAAEWLVSALVSKDHASGTNYGHRAAIITANSESDAKGQALDKFLVGSYRLESIDLKPLTRPDQSLIASLTDALEPFARVAEVKPMKHRQQGDIVHVTETTLGKAPIRFSDCDRAAAALASAKGAN